MNLSEQGTQLLIDREAKRKKAYLDSKGIPTIGVGHTGPEVKIGLEWTDSQVMEAFKKDIVWAENAVNGVKAGFSQNQFDALVSFVFNIGASAFGRSTMKKCLEQNNFAAASNEFDKWKIPPEVISRRMGEKAQFLGKAFVARM